VSEVEIKIDPVLYAVLEQLKEVKKDINASQEILKKDIRASQEEIKKEVNNSEEELNKWHKYLTRPTGSLPK
jgi:hypothetical protein